MTDVEALTARIERESAFLRDVIAEVERCQLCDGQIADLLGPTEHARQVGVVRDHRNAVGTRVHVGLEVLHTEGERVREGEQGVLRRLRGVAAMRNPRRGRRWSSARTRERDRGEDGGEAAHRLEISAGAPIDDGVHP